MKHIVVFFFVVVWIVVIRFLYHPHSFANTTHTHVFRLSYPYHHTFMMMMIFGDVFGAFFQVFPSYPVFCCCCCDCHRWWQDGESLYDQDEYTGAKKNRIFFWPFSTLLIFSMTQDREWTKRMSINLFLLLNFRQVESNE